MSADRVMQVGEVSFYCGGGLCDIHVTNEHDVFAHEYDKKRRVAWHAEHGEWPSMDQSVEWREAAYNASLRSLTVDDAAALDAARELLEARGYVVTDSLAGVSVLAVESSRSSPNAAAVDSALPTPTPERPHGE